MTNGEVIALLQQHPAEGTFIVEYLADDDEAGSHTIRKLECLSVTQRLVGEVAPRTVVVMQATYTF